MGEAKRRKQNDPNYGKSPNHGKSPNYKKPFFSIAKSSITNKFVIQINHRGEHCTISPHYELSGAEHGLKQCEKCLETFSPDELNKPLNYWFYTFIQRLNADFNYDDDDEILGVGHLVDGVLHVDSSKATIDEQTALINMESIKTTGQRLYR